MTRLALSFTAAALLATGGWSAVGKSVFPAQPGLQVIAHVYAHPHRESVSALHANDAASRHFFL